MALALAVASWWFNQLTPSKGRYCLWLGQNSGKWYCAMGNEIPRWEMVGLPTCLPSIHKGRSKAAPPLWRRSSRLLQSLSFRQKWRSWYFMTCVSPVEVFLAAAGAFFWSKNGVPGILWHVLCLKRSSRLPQAPFLIPKWRCYDCMTCIRRGEVLPGCHRRLFWQ